MKKSLLVMVVSASLVCSAAQGQGFLSSIKGKLTGNDEAAQQQQQQQQMQAQQQPVAAQATPAPAEARGRTVKGEGGQSVKIVQGTPAPAAQPTPTKEEIKKGAARLKTAMAPERIPGNLFDNYVGTWNGDFWVYSPNGQLEESKSVKIEYAKNGKQLEMKTFYADRLGKSWIVAETATYTNEGDHVKVAIRRPSNDIATQTGRYNDKQLFLVADIKDGVEHYRERIDGQRLLVDGFGVYGGSDSHVFIGRFVRQR